MSRESITRRVFLETSVAVAAGGALMPHELWAAGQDAVLDVPRSNNHTGYEKVAWKARPFPMAQVRLKPGPLKDMQERDRVFSICCPTTACCTAFALRRVSPPRLSLWAVGRLPTANCGAILPAVTISRPAR